MSNFYLSVLAMDKNFYTGECEYLTLPMEDGSYGILAHHSNMIAAVLPGELAFRVPGGEMQYAAVSEGIVKIEDNDVQILVGTVERPEEIDINRARRKADEAREIMLQKKQVREYKSAQAQLVRAMTRLKVSKNHES